MGKLRLSEGIDLHYGGITENNVALTDGNRNVTMATGASGGKFAVMNASVHGSYDFYNNGTSYLNGATIIDANLTVQSGTLTVSGGSTNVVANFVSSDGIAAIKLQDSAGNVELSASGSQFRVQPSGGSAVFTVESGGNTNITGDLTLTQSSGNNILYLNSSGGGNPVIYMEDSNRKWGQFVASSDLYFKDENANINALILNAGGIATFGNTVEIPAVLRHVGDTDTYLQFTDGEVDLFANGQNTFLTSSGGVVINPLSVSTCDFVAKGDNDSALLYADASADKVGIGDSAPVAKLEVRDSTTATDTIIASAGLATAGNYHELVLGDGRNYAVGLRRHITQSNPGWLRPRLDFIVQDQDTYLPADREVRMSIRHDGKVGIGTTSPDRILTVSGTLGIGIDDYIVHNGDSNSFFGFNGADSWKVRTGGGDRLVIGNDNSYFNTNLGVGVSSPASKLSAAGTVRSEGFTTISSGAGTEVRYDSSAGWGGILAYDRSNSAYKELRVEGSIIKFKESGTDVMTIDGNKVGINETSPDCKLHINEDTKDNTVLKLQNYLATANGATYLNWQELLFQAGGSGPYAGIRQYANGWQNSDAALAFWTQQHGGSYAERMRIDGDGNIGIGDSNPPSNTKVAIQADGIGIRLDGTANTTRSIFFRNTTASNPAQIYADGSLRLRTEDSGTDILFHINSTGTNNEAMRINNSRHVLVGRTSTSGVDTDGHVLFRTGASYQSANSSNTGSVLYLNKNGDNGDLIQLYKSGSHKANIGLSSHVYVSHQDGKGLGIDGTRVFPTNADGTAINNSMDIGLSSFRFRHLYLSGAAYAESLTINGSSVIDSSRNLKNLGFIDAISSGGSGTGSQVIKLRNPNDTSYTADALTAYNATTSWDISDRVTLSQSSRANSGSIHTYINETSTEAVAYERFVQLNNSNANSTYGMRSMHFYQYDGSGSANTDMRKPSGKLLTVHTYEVGNVEEQLSLDSDGDLTVAGSASANSLTINGQQVINSSRQMTNLSTITSGAHTINGSQYNPYMTFNVSGVTRGRIGVDDTTTANIYFSNSSSSSSGIGLRIEGYINTNKIIPCYGDGTETDNLTDFGTSGARWKNIYAGSNIYAGADVVAYSSSDERLKDNLERIQQPIEKIQKISGYEFDWNDNQDTFEGHDIGVVAQEVEKVLPEIVETRENGYKAVKYEKMVALLIEGMKEQQEQIKELQEQVQELSKQK